jgi:hypothetical protein
MRSRHIYFNVVELKIAVLETFYRINAWWSPPNNDRGKIRSELEPKEAAKLAISSAMDVSKQLIAISSGFIGLVFTLLNVVQSLRENLSFLYWGVVIALVFSFSIRKGIETMQRLTGALHRMGLTYASEHYTIYHTDIARAAIQQTRLFEIGTVMIVLYLCTIFALALFQKY